MAAQIVLDFTDAEMLTARKEVGEARQLENAQGEPRSATQNEVRRFILDELRAFVQGRDADRKRRAITAVAFDPQ